VRRILVGGISGAGKTTLGRRLADHLALPFVEMDALFHGPGWVPRPQFEADVDAATAGDAWVVDSHGYAQVRDLVWSRADTLVWLDLRRPVVMGRVLRRSFARATYDRELWNHNTEGFADWLDPGHPVRWAWTQHNARRAEIADRVADPRWAHVAVVRLDSPRSARRWLAALPNAGPNRASSGPPL
jgi:adenylate kinase family enzyme